MTYQTPKKTATAQINIKKSDFIAFAYPIHDREDAMFHVEQLKGKYPDARHHCWAYIIGDPNNTTSAGFDDDGEPSGTAGRPILNVLQHKQIGNILVVVVRYFGGIKLGAGGLTRAYSSATQAVVDELALVPYVPKIQCQIKTDFAHEAQVRYLLENIHGRVIDVQYQKMVILTVSLAKKDLSQLKDSLSMMGEIIEETVT